MASATMVSVSDYLRSDYEPDAEYVDGEIEERAMGELDHSRLQRILMLLLNTEACLQHFICYSELRVQTSALRLRVPDVCLLRVTAPEEQIVQTPPLLCIEILSPEDTMRRTTIRVSDFLSMGVPQVWVVDSETRTVQVCAGSTITMHTEGDLPIPESPITLPLARLFQAFGK